MAEIRLGRYEIESRALPHVCLKCGAPAAIHKKKKFHWHPAWVNLFVFFGLLPCAILMIVLRKSMTVPVPLCERHKNHWLWRQVVGIGGVVLLLVGLFGGLALNSARGNEASDALAGTFCFGIALYLFVWVVIWIVLSVIEIKPNEITDHTITLKGVHQHFIDAMHRLRRANPPPPRAAPTIQPTHRPSPSGPQFYDPRR
jgi:hypothetical protein